MKFTKLTSQIKLSSALITATTILGAAILSVPLLLTTNTSNKTTSNNIDYKNNTNQNNNLTTNTLDFSSQPAEIQDFFSVYDNKKIYANKVSNSIFVVVTHEDGYDSLYAWGDNANGKLGLNNTAAYIACPTLVTGIPLKANYTHVATSLNATTIVVNGNALWNAGDNMNCERGDGTINGGGIFVRNSTWSGATILSLSVGYHHRIVTTIDKVYVWGANGQGQLGIGNTDPQINRYDFTAKITQLTTKWAEGKFFAFGNNTAFLFDKVLRLWGANNYGQIGIKAAGEPYKNIPAYPVQLEDKIAKFAFGEQHSMVLLENGNLWSWGLNDYGQLGVNNGTNANPNPIQITRKFDNTLIGNVTDVFASANSSFIISNNKIYGSGRNHRGILGNNTTVSKVDGFITTILPSNSEITNVIALKDSLMVNLKSGLYMVGCNEFGQFAQGVVSTELHKILEPVNPFGTNSEITTKLSNKSYYIEDAFADLDTNKTTIQIIKLTLNKYASGANNLIGTTLTYKTGPTISPDKLKITMTLTTNISYNVDNVKTLGNFDIPVEITNFRFKNSEFATQGTISAWNLNKDNIKQLLETGQPLVEDRYLQMFVLKNTFPVGTKFIVTNSEINVSNQTYTCVLSYDKYYENELLKENGSRKFVLKNLKVIEKSEMIFTGFKDDSIHSANIKELLIKSDKSLNQNVLTQFVDISTLPPNNHYSIENWTDLDANKTYTGGILANQYYNNWDSLINKTFDYVFSGITIVANSEIVDRELTSDYNINNIETSLKKGSVIVDDKVVLDSKVLDQFIKTSRFPPNTTFELGTINKYIDGGKYTFGIIPSRHYVNGIAVDNTTKIPYSVTLQFRASNLALIIGLSVGAAALLAIIILIYIMRYGIQVKWWHMLTKKYLE